MPTTILFASTVPASARCRPATRAVAPRVLTVRATELALRHMGRPVPNAALLGGFAALTGRLRLESVETAIRQRFPRRLADGNVAAAREAFQIVRVEGEELSHA